MATVPPGFTIVSQPRGPVPNVPAPAPLGPMPDAAPKAASSVPTGPGIPQGFTVVNPGDVQRRPSGPKVQDQGFFADVFSSVGRGANDLTTGMDTIGYMLGMTNEDDLVQQLKRDRADAAGYAKSPQLIEAEKQWRESRGLGAVAALFNPRLLGSMIGGSLPSIIPGIAGGVAGAAGGGLIGSAPGAGIGAVAGGSIGAGASEYGPAFWQYMADNGTDLDDEAQVRRALADPEKVSAAHEQAMVRSGTAAAFTAVTGVLGGRFVPRFVGPGKGVGSNVTGAGVGLGIAGAGEAATGVTGDVILGQPVDPKQAMADFVVGSLVDAPGTVAGPIAESAWSKMTGVRASKGAGQTVAGVPPPPAGVSPGSAPNTPARPANVLTPAQAAVGEALAGPSTASPEYAEPYAETMGDASPFFYSNVLKSIEKLPVSASGEQMLATLRGIPGVKEEELADAGLLTLLRSGNTVTRDQIHDMVDNNLVSVSIDVNTSFNPEAAAKQLEIRKQQEVIRDQLRSIDTQRQRLTSIIQDPKKSVDDALAASEVYRSMNERRRSLMDQMVELDRERTYLAGLAKPDTLWQDFASPVTPDETGLGAQNAGAKRYTEFLFRSRPRERVPGSSQGDINAVVPVGDTPDPHVPGQSMRRTYRAPGGELVSVPYPHWRSEEENRRMVLEDLEEQTYGLKPEDRAAAHWARGSNHGTSPTRPAFAHMRTSERSIGGVPTLFVEEIQSDNHQQGRKVGYASEHQAPRSVQSVRWFNRLESEVSFLSDFRWTVKRVPQPFTPPDVRVTDPFAQRPYGDPDWPAAIFDREGKDITATITDPAVLYWLKRVNDDAKAYTSNPDLLYAAPVPDLPLKRSWEAMAWRAAVRYAASRGITRVALNRGEQAAAVLGDHNNEGLKKFYNEKMVNVVKDYAKRMGATVGKGTMDDAFTPTTENLDFQPDDDWGLAVDYRDNPATIPGKPLADVTYVDIPKLTMDKVKLQGVPLYIKAEASGAPLTPEGEALQAATLQSAADRLASVTQQIAAAFGLKDKLFINFRTGTGPDIPGTNVRGAVWEKGQKLVGAYRMDIWVGRHTSVAELYSTFAHELGHAVQFETFENASPELKEAVEAEFHRMREQWKPGSLLKEVWATRNNFVVQMTGLWGAGEQKLYNVDPDKLQYFTLYTEWFAEQFAKWMTTNEKPLTIVDQWFKALANKIRKMFDAFRTAVLRGSKNFGTLADAAPVQVLADWFNTQMDSAYPWVQQIIEAGKEKRRIENEAAMRKAGHAPGGGAPGSPATRGFRTMVKRLWPGGDAPNSVNVAGAYVDKISKFSEWMLTLPQVAQRNPFNMGLQKYNELVQIMNLEKIQIMDGAMVTLDKWRKLHSQGDNVARMLDLYANFKPKSGPMRRPTAAELDAMAKSEGVTPEGMEVFQQIVADFDNMLVKFKETLYREAGKITDPMQQASKLAAIDAQMQQLAMRPFVPLAHFGDFTVTVKANDGKLISLSTRETQRQQRAEYEAARREYPESAGYVVQMGKIPSDARTLMGLPGPLLDLIEKNLELSDDQKSVLEELKYEYSPAASWRRNVGTGKKRIVRGYSQDFKRAYASHFFHGSNFLVRAKYVGDARSLIAGVRHEAKGLANGVGRQRIADFMADHLKEYMDPKWDMPLLRGATFFWHLAFSPAAAAINLTQIPFATLPYLASNFGDVKAAAALTKAMGRMQTFYKTGKLRTLAEDQKTADFAVRALNEGVQDGTISEAMAPGLAAISEGGALSAQFGSALSRGFQHVQKWGAYLFQMAEQANRRITFSAALELAYADPNSKFVQDILKQHTMQYENLLTAGWTAQEAQAYIAAKHTVQQTQFIYSKYGQAKFMRGKMRVLFAFKSFVQNMLFYLWNNKGAAARSMLIMAFVGGLMGLPGAEDLEQVLKALGWQLFGKDFDLEREARKYIVDVTEDPEVADSVLLGASRTGFGVPALFGMMGMEFPSFDRSGNVGMGQVLPLPVGDLLGPPGKETDTRIAQGLQKASGATFGVFFNAYKAMTDWQLDPTDPRRWERAMPAAARNISRMFRLWHDGAETNRQGAVVANFDTNDPVQMAELFGIGAGYNPTRMSRQFDRVTAQLEMESYWDIRRQMLLISMDEARRAGDRELIQSIMGDIRNFNSMVPNEARGKKISADQLRQSLEARQRSRAAQTTGVPSQRSSVPFAQEAARLYGPPEGVVIPPGGRLLDSRPVR